MLPNYTDKNMDRPASRWNNNYFTLLANSNTSHVNKNLMPDRENIVEIYWLDHQTEQ